MNEKQCECTLEACDIFDFMANHVGMTVIHPGGFDATRKLAESCHLDNQTRVVDIACGKGTSAVYLAERYGFEVVGIDISVEGLINTGKVMFKYMTNSRIRKRMSTMRRFFREHADDFGYGIYTGRK